MIVTPALRGVNFSDRPTQLRAGAIAVGILVLAFALTIGTGNFRPALMLGGVLVAPVAIYAALRAPYAFAYGLYCLLVPFDNLLKLGGAGTLTKLLGLATLLAVVLYAARLRQIERPRRALVLWLVFLLWNMITMMWSPDGEEAATTIAQLFSLIGLYAVLSVAPIGERALRTLAGWIVAGGVAGACYGIWLLHQLPPQTVQGDAGRLMIQVGQRDIDSNHFANALLFPLAIALVSLLNARRPRALVLSAGAAAIIASGILVSLSREALLGCVILVAVVVWFSRRRILGFAVGIPALAAIVVAVPGIGERMAQAFTTGGAGRTSIWSVAFLAYKDHPFFGWGLGGALEAYDRHYLAVYQLYNAGWTRPPHNTPLHVAVDLGIVGLALYLAANLASLLQTRLIARGDRLYDLRVATTAALLALAFVSLFIDLLTYKYLWIALAFAAQLANVSRSRAA